MTKDEALQKFISHIDQTAVKLSFPDIEYVATELEDGQQEIIVRLHGKDPDFYPSADYGEIENISIQEVPYAIKNTITLRRFKNNQKMDRRRRFHLAILKRVKNLIKNTGLSQQQFCRILREHMPGPEGGDIV